MPRIFHPPLVESGVYIKPKGIQLGDFTINPVKSLFVFTPRLGRGVGWLINICRR